MAVQDYVWTMSKVLIEEGGYCWLKGDPGGPTNFGITCYDLAQYEGKKMTSMAAWVAPVKAMTIATADIIYAKKYQPQCHFNDLKPGMDMVVLDYGINSGPSRSIKSAQQVLKIHVDGICGPVTLAALNAADPVNFINDLSAARLAFMKSIRGGSAWAEFGKDWGGRVERIRNYSLELATNGVPDPKSAFLTLYDKVDDTQTPKAYALEDMDSIIKGE